MSVTCPLCEEYTGTRKQVRAHIQGKGDEAHKGVGFQKADQLLDAQGHKDQSPSSSSISSPSSGELDVPADDPPEQNEPDGGDDYSCPHCSGDLYDLREHPGEADFQCVECGAAFSED